MSLAAGTRLGPYQIQQPLGSGGMGEVYLAEDTRLRRQVALKILPAAVISSPGRRTRFEREARAAASLNHPNICTVFDAGDADGCPYIAMEYCQGTTLAARLRERPLTMAEVVEIAMQVVDALDEAHRHHIVHRDLKSENIFLLARGHVKLLDFGLAKEIDPEGGPGAATRALTTQEGVVFGTPAYMSPEQALGRPLDARSDLFSFGVVLYAMLTGKLPFGGETATEQIDALLHQDPPPIPRYNDEAPDAIVRLVRKMLEKDPELRAQSAREIWNDLRRIREDATGLRTDTPAAGRTPTQKPRMLVLPFINSSGDAGQEYFSDAVTDEIITELAALAPDRLAVLARTTAMRYKGTNKDVAAICRELSADYIVEGSVRRSEDQVVINIQVIRGAGETHVLAKRYDAPIRDLFATEHAIARAVGAQLDVLPATAAAAGPAGTERPRRAPTRDLAAYTSYAQGRYRMHRGADDTAKAKQLFEEAIRRDPQFALAYDALAEWYWWVGFAGLMPPRDACSRGLLHAARAAEIDHTLAETHAMIAVYRLRLEYDWPEVDREMRLALELNPASPVVRLRYATSGLMPHGRLDEAVAEIERSLELDPLSLTTRMWLVVLLWLKRDTERAIDEARTAVGIDPTFGLSQLQMGLALCLAGRFDEAVEALRQAVRLFPVPITQGWLGFALAVSGNVFESRQMLERFHAMAAQAYVPPTNFAWIHLGLGEIDEAFAWMDKAVDACDGMMTPIKSYWFLDPIRDDPRFAALLGKMKLA